MSCNFNQDFLLSICIPTFNRDLLLRNLFDSIDSNYNNRVEVVVVDDGSSDLTSEICDAYKDLLNIKYIYQTNSGRSHALRKSVINASGKYALIMDSDDIFVPSGVNIIVESLLNGPEKNLQKNISGVVFLCARNGNLIGRKFNTHKAQGNLLRDVADLGIWGDKKEVVRLELLKKFMYEPYESEKRMATSILWNRISSEYDIINMNQIVVDKDYYNDGLSKNIDKVRMLSCKSSALYYSEALNYHKVVYLSTWYAFKMAANLVRYSFHCRSIFFTHLSKRKIVFIYISSPLGICLYIRDKIRYYLSHK